jgi:cytochrome c oxidase subunit II
MQKKTKILLLFIIIVTLTGCASDATTEQAAQLIAYQAGAYDDLEPTGELIDGVREIDITATRFFWDPKVVVVNYGETVRLNIETIDTPHGFEIEGFTIPDYDISTSIEVGSPISVEFEANEQGAWDVICTIYCGAGHGSMKAIFVIK